MFVDLDWRLNAWSLLSASAELLVFTVEDETTFIGRLFHNGIILLEKLYLRVSIESEIDKDYAGELSHHTLFDYAWQLTNQYMGKYRQVMGVGMESDRPT